MSIRNLNIKMSYAGKGDVILKEFLLPVIKEAVNYDRVTSFYNVESLLAISQGIQSLYEKQGKMRLIIGIHSFPAELVEASVRKEYIIDQVEKVREEISNGIILLSDALEKERLATLAWMIQDKLLEVKAAAVKGVGIFHPKTIILSDGEDKIVAVGSPNETGSGLGGNFEQIMVANSWDSPESVAVQEEFFESLWNDEQDDAIIYDISEETAELILNSLGTDYKKMNNEEGGHTCEGLIRLSAKMPSNFFVSGDIPALYMHQERAVIDALSRWPVRVLFSDEVGLGKTFEVAATMSFLIKYCGIKKVVILTPKSVLKQWQEELSEHFDIDAWLYDSVSKVYLSSQGKEISIGNANPLGAKAPNIVLMSAQYARGAGDKQNLFSKSGTIFPDLLILDEAHSARVSKGISGGKKKTRMYSMLESVAPKIPHLILATATPMLKDADEYHAILKLLGLPKAWQKERVYRSSLRLIASNDIPDISDAYTAASLLMKTLSDMSPDLKRLTKREKDVLSGLMLLKNKEDPFGIGNYVQSVWSDFRTMFIKLHPAHLLTVRNTRRSLMTVGYKFPQRNLHEESVEDSINVQLFYYKVNQYLTDNCFSVEQLLYPDRKISVGFVRVSYQQRVASSLYSCKQSLERRLEKMLDLKKKLDYHENNCNVGNCGMTYESNMDDIDLDDLFGNDGDDETITSSKIDMEALRRAVGIETTALASLVKEAENLLISSGDLKILRALDVAEKCVKNGDVVLLFSRYKDTIDALVEQFKAHGDDKNITYGIYTGGQALIVDKGQSIVSNKSSIKMELFAGRLKIMFCSDAASEGLNLQAARVLINVDVPWTPARLEQRIGRIARLGQVADEVDVYNIWYPHSIEARMYHRIQKRLEETNLAIGEFPEIVAASIRQAVLENKDEDNMSIEQLKEIRNSFQIAALEELWNSEIDGTTTSRSMRNDLIDICRNSFKIVGDTFAGRIQQFMIKPGEVVGLTAVDGMPETISLQSKPWTVIDYSAKNLDLICDRKNQPIAFAYIKGIERIIIKHSEVLRIILGEDLEKIESLEAYPQMLPDNKRLNLEYAISCDLETRPQLWID